MRTRRDAVIDALVSLAAILLLMLPAIVWPAQDRVVVGVHALSFHAGSGAQNLQTVTPGAFVRAAGWQAGVYQNSHSDTSAYVVREFQVHSHVSVFAGGVTGYRVQSDLPGLGGKVAPLVALSARLPDVGTTTPRLTATPPVRGVSRGALHLTLEWSL